MINFRIEKRPIRRIFARAQGVVVRGGCVNGRLPPG
jgi:hypothetical protein